MAFVFKVNALFTSEGEILKVNSSGSTKTGVNPACIIDKIEAMLCLKKN